MKKWLKKRRMPANNENGYTLIIVIMTLVVISVLGLGLMGTTASTLKQTDSERIDQATYYIAESGIIQKRDELNQVVENAYYCAKNNFVPSSKATAEENEIAFKNFFYSLTEKEIVKYSPSLGENIVNTKCKPNEANSEKPLQKDKAKIVDSVNNEI
ncbi:MAG TPA: pilus assembly PilX N-terminal domain-containing protein, partial [Rummeliibacillus sp.]|nr:pilus assembly PilX N-terminal domain-containing protein [Rummeliibacillus sp.]